MTIIGTLLRSPYRIQQLPRATKSHLAINDLRTLITRSQSYKMSNEAYPAALTDVPMGNMRTRGVSRTHI